MNAREVAEAMKKIQNFETTESPNELYIYVSYNHQSTIGTTTRGYRVKLFSSVD